MTLNGHFILLNFMDIMVIIFLIFMQFFLIFLTNNVTYKLWFSSNQDSLDQARQKAINHSSRDESSNMNQVKKNLCTLCRKQLQKTISESESESDSDPTPVIPKPPEF